MKTFVGKHLNCKLIFPIKTTREAFKKKCSKLGSFAKQGGGSDRMGRMTQPPYMVIRNFKTTSHFLKSYPPNLGH